MAQPVGFARHARAFAQFHEMLLERDFMADPKFASRARAKRFKPRGERGADFHQAALACLGLARCDFNVSRHAPHVRPIQAQQFGSAESGQPANGDDRAECGVGGFGGFQQRGKFVRGVKLHGGGVGAFGAHGVGFVQAMRRGEIIFADCPLQELADGGAVVVAGFGGVGGAAIARRGFHRVKLADEGVQVFLAQIANGGTRERGGETVQLQLPVVGVFARTVAPAGLRRLWCGARRPVKIPRRLP